VGPATIDRQAFDLPLIGRFSLSDALEEIWWVRPGVETDPLGVLAGAYTVDETGSFGAGTASDQFFRPLVGLWAERGSQLPNSQVLWYRENDSNLRLAFQSANFTVMLEDVVVGCFFEDVIHATALRGDFDGDDKMEIFWVSANPFGANVLWRDTAAMFDPNAALPCAPENASIMGPGRRDKPIVGDFDGDGSDDIYWDGLQAEQDSLWLDVGNMLGPTIIPPVLDGTAQPFVGDATAVVGDFNGDFCDDIFWFTPGTDWTEFAEDPTDGDVIGTPASGNHPLWRSKCNNGPFEGFMSDLVNDIPMDAYPVGLDPRSAVRRADLP